MLKLKLEADSLADLVKLIERDLNCDVIFHDLETATAVADAKGTLVPPVHSEMAQVITEDGKVIAEYPIPVVQTPDPAPAPEPEKQRKPGRPRKNTNQAPAGAPAAELTAPAAVPASQPAVENIGSSEPVQALPAGDQAEAGGAAKGEAKAPEAAPPSDAKPVDAAGMRAALQAYNSRIGGDDGLLAVAEVLAGFSYQKISEVKAEHYGPIAAEAQKRLAALPEKQE